MYIYTCVYVYNIYIYVYMRAERYEHWDRLIQKWECQCFFVIVCMQVYIYICVCVGVCMHLQSFRSL